MVDNLDFILTLKYKTAYLTTSLKHILQSCISHYKTYLTAAAVTINVTSWKQTQKKKSEKQAKNISKFIHMIFINIVQQY